LIRRALELCHGDLVLDTAASVGSYEWFRTFMTPDEIIRAHPDKDTQAKAYAERGKTQRCDLPQWLRDLVDQY
jgi:hypothetical protein